MVCVHLQDTEFIAITALDFVVDVDVGVADQVEEEVGHDGWNKDEGQEESSEEDRPQVRPELRHLDRVLPFKLLCNRNEVREAKRGNLEG